MPSSFARAVSLRPCVVENADFKYKFTMVNSKCFRGWKAMKLQVIQPQEVEVFYVLPAIRSRMASALKGQGMKQKDIAELLCVQESTVSQYLSSKRAADVKFNSAIDKEISTAAKKIKTKEGLIRETQRILELVRKDKGVLCGLHKAVSDVPQGCNACFKSEQ